MISQSPSFVIRSVLGAEDIVCTPAQAAVDATRWPCFISNMGLNPDNAVAVYDTGVNKDSKPLRGGIVTQSYNVQVRVKAKEYVAGYEMVKRVTDQIDAIDRLMIDAERYWYFIPGIVRVNSPLFLGVETIGPKRNNLWTINTYFHCTEWGPYEEELDDDSLDRENFFQSITNFHTLIHVDYPTWFLSQ